nr:asparaginyl endopeptidase 1 [Tanacetum cinerariifolium]
MRTSLIRYLVNPLKKTPVEEVAPVKQKYDHKKWKYVEMPNFLKSKKSFFQKVEDIGNKLTRQFGLAHLGLDMNDKAADSDDEEEKKEGNAARYVTRSQAVKFIDALQDLNDCLTMVHLFAALPAIERERIQPERIHNCRGIEMVGLILFGPEKARSTLRSVRAPKRIVDDLKCFKSTLESFEKHGCLLPELGLRHMRAFTNICNYVAKKAAIKEALIVSRAMTKTKKYDIDVRNPSVEATSAPLLRSQDNYYARIFVNGTSRKKLESYARPYRVLLAVSQKVHQKLHYMAEKVQSCFHRQLRLTSKSNTHGWLHMHSSKSCLKNQDIDYKIMLTFFLRVERCEEEKANIGGLVLMNCVTFTAPHLRSIAKIRLFRLRKKIEKVEEKAVEIVKEALESSEKGVEAIERGKKEIQSEVSYELGSGGGLMQAGMVAGAEVVVVWLLPLLLMGF